MVISGISPLENSGEYTRTQPQGAAPTKGTRMSFDPTKYGITAEMSEMNLAAARNAYVVLVENVKAQSESTQNAEKQLREKYGNAEVSIVNPMREAIWAMITQEPASSVALFEALAEIKTDVKTFRDVFIQEEVRAGRVTIEVPAELAERKSEAESLGEFIRSLYKVMTGMGTELPNFPVKKLEKSGEVVPDLPRLPSGPREAGSKAGRTSKTSMLRFTIDGEEVPANTTLRSVLIQVSDSRHVFSVAWLQDELKKLNQDLFKTWEVKLPNGIVLGGFVPADATEEEISEETEE